MDIAECWHVYELHREREREREREIDKGGERDITANTHAHCT
jgi:hypothetical protein